MKIVKDFGALWTMISKVQVRYMSLICILWVMVASVVSFADTIRLDEPPGFPVETESLVVSKDLEFGKNRVFAVTGGFTVNTQDRDESKNFFDTFYLVSDENPEVSIGWTGNYSTCDEGGTDQGFREGVLRRLNYFRAMAGVPTNVTFDETFNSKAQKAAFMMSRNGQLSHNPPETWECFSDEGAEGADKSNLGLGVFGKEGIDLFIKDSGDGNFFVGHRRWILFPQTQVMGTGNVPGNGMTFMPANALWVFDSNTFGSRPGTRDEFVAWPPPGFVPYQVVFARWSFSFPGASFLQSTVSMASNGKTIPIKLEDVSGGFGENTLVWIPNNLSNQADWPKPQNDTTYTINIDNVDVDGMVRNFSYDVTIFDPVSAPTNGKLFTFECNSDFKKGPLGLERLVMELGQDETCRLKLVNFKPNTFVEIITSLVTGPRSSVIIDPPSSMTNNNGELEFTISAVESGIDWVAWAIMDEDGKVEFNKRAYDSGEAWGMFVDVR